MNLARPMDPTAASRVRFTSWLNRVLNSFAVAVSCLIPGAITLDTSLESFVWVGLPAAVWLIPRALRMGVWIDDTSCTVRNLLRTRKVQLCEVDRFDFEPTGATMYRNEAVVLLMRSGRSITITVLTLPRPSFLQGPGRARCRAMNAELGRRRAA